MTTVRTELMLIDGDWCPSSDGEVLPVEDPATTEIVATIPVATKADLERSLLSSERSWREWRKTNGWERSRILRQAAINIDSALEEIAQLLTLEQGKPLAQSRSEIKSCVEQFDWYADEARRIYGRTVQANSPDSRIQVQREPIGPVAAFTPWNFPVLLAARKIAPALAAGCTMILMPANEAPSACLAITRAIQEAGLPNGVLNVVSGNPETISTHLVASPIIRKISLTGSLRVGQILMRLASSNMLDVSMELGGHAPVIVTPDVDVAEVSRLSVLAKFRNAGQVCTSPTRFFVHETVIEDFTSEFASHVARLNVGAGTHPETDIGPLTNKRRLDEVSSLVEDSVDQFDARIVTGGIPLSRKPGYFYAPTVLRDVSDEATIMNNEPFGPIAMINSYAAANEAVQRANATTYGLAAYAFTSKLEDATYFSEGLEAGMVGINTFNVSTAAAPFSGIKTSGIGAEGGTEGIDAYLHVKSTVTGFNGLV